MTWLELVRRRGELERLDDEVAAVARRGGPVAQGAVAGSGVPASRPPCRALARTCPCELRTTSSMRGRISSKRLAPGRVGAVVAGQRRADRPVAVDHPDALAVVTRAGAPERQLVVQRQHLLARPRPTRLLAGQRPDDLADGRRRERRRRPSARRVPSGPPTASDATASSGAVASASASTVPLDVGGVAHHVRPAGTPGRCRREPRTRPPAAAGPRRRLPRPRPPRGPAAARRPARAPARAAATDVGARESPSTAPPLVTSGPQDATSDRPVSADPAGRPRAGGTSAASHAGLTTTTPSRPCSDDDPGGDVAACAGPPRPW